MSPLENRRILLVDDMPAIHQDFYKILRPQAQECSKLDAVEAALFGGEPMTSVIAVAFEVDSAYQGQEALARVQGSLEAGRPYALAFVDMRMPPGWDGVETIERLWQVDERLQIVVCTAYSDTPWDEVLMRLEVRDRLLILKKPFDAIEVRQLANSLTAKWQMTQDAAGQRLLLEETVIERTREITRAIEALKEEIVERKHLQGQLQQSEKLASIGQLAAGVAHEINNPIGYIFSNFGTLEGYLGKLFDMLVAYERAEPSVGIPDVASGLRELRERIELEFLKEDIPALMRESRQGIVRVSQIVQDLKDFSRVDSMQDFQWANLHQGIDSTLNIVASEIKYKADVIKEYGAIPDVECLPSQINQVVMNLLVNAAHAMGERRGCITIRTGTGTGEVWLEVADDGSGIPPETLKRIFEPFFTTKPVGLGTGLGLSVSYGIVKKHRGHIDVESAIGQGTTFRVTLPIHRPSPKDELERTDD
ncbi:ATP-binding protein [Variovorax arabinosiphilus]|uniref:ATP-binding protein n=1 Tax=Variovorax arabinosiphilus TaxID=3053498 RepID=UPI002576600B|nr:MULTISPECIES: ATP-binding protein [unclassified Variovorax]MDM0120078.1 ATP-binding protein [Variovorax sp. J2L1-78]MDM0128009.1 ATP-binding protein [Variovorax sp. J2L1-63]MDM0231709.1 ATP-binding protein [Variovorax sp. J2R1-6]